LVFPPGADALFGENQVFERGIVDVSSPKRASAGRSEKSCITVGKKNEKLPLLTC
jgi:hypothetical protein